MTRRFLYLPIAIGLWTLLSYSLLVGMSYMAINPVSSIFSPEPEFRQHGKPVLDLAGFILWFEVLVVYAAGSAAMAARLLELRRSFAIGLAIGVLLVSSLYVAIVHPTLLLMLLGPEWWARYSSIAQRYVPGLEEIYQHWGLPRLKYWVLAGQVVLTTVICLLTLLPASCRSGGIASRAVPSRPPEGQEDKGRA